MLLAFVMLFGNIYICKERKGIKDTVVGSYIEACCLWVLFLFALTEMLSIGRILRFRFLFAAWGLLDMLLLCWLVMQLKRIGFTMKAAVKWVWEAGIHGAQALRESSFYGILILIGIAVLGLSLITVPYNWDSMTYHLPRIAHWAQNHSVAHFATHSIRQIASPVLAEFINLHVYILCRGHDWFFNLLQGVSYLTGAVMVAAIASKFSCDKRFCFLASLLYMTMPIAFAEALTTQNDVFATIWLLFFTYRLLEYTDLKTPMRFKRITVFRVGTMGLCVAWGYLAKPSVCVGMVVFALWLVGVCVKRRDRVRDLAGIFFCSLPCVALPLLPEILRNFKSFGAYSSPSAGARQLAGTLQPHYLIVNLLKNFSFNMPTPLVQDGNEIFAGIAVTAAKFLGNVELDAESISENGRAYGLHEAGTYGCDTAVSPMILWLFIFCVLWVLLRFGKTEWKKSSKGYVIAATLSFLIFCTILRWEPFVGRYMISYLALLCPAIAVILQLKTAGEKRLPLRWGIVGVVSFLCVMEFLNLFRYHYINFRDHASTRPWDYYAIRWEEMAPAVALTDEVKSRGYKNVGLVLGGDDYEYPLWKMLEGCRLEHVLVKGDSAVYTDESFVPDCIIWFGKLPDEPVQIGNQVYHQISEYAENRYLMEN